MITPAERATPLLAVAGPTAVGKSAAVLALADLLDRDGVRFTLVSADSRQVFRGFDIGTDKLSAEVRARRPHAGIDVAEADQPFTLYDWLAIAREAISAPTASGAPQIAIAVGGTGLYHRGLLRGFLTGGARPHDPELRARLERELAEEGREHIEVQLRGLNAAAADAVATASPRRLLRALEIAQLGGDPTATEEEPWSGPNAYVLLDEPDSAAHRTAIAERATAQFANGLVAETEALAARLPAETPALSGIGYREALQYRLGEISEEKAITHSSGRSWAYARRQRTWYRGEPISTTINAGSSQTTARVAADLHALARTLIEQTGA
ncbi:MAG: tRNA (adenosine(37)-N6)-dimethylallyltransferase MiaA [Candidatus Limnocylindrus sp. ZSMar2m-chloro-G89]|nr:MAG: tRNA (adenosine(37)-N6)-dimethylallyltransferase MiaA [Candidatus Limnocylindrus sp.]RLT49481.1 MAG: tRNA (adenosine(37)-N6)-dimethylallyltransferase MiaA [Candidatus Limnocylindrus sp. ZSMar2m-chloro-G89]